MPQFDFLSYLGQIFFVFFFFYLIYFFNLSQIMIVQSETFKIRKWLGFLHYKTITKNILFLETQIFFNFCNFSINFLTNDYIYLKFIFNNINVNTPLNLLFFTTICYI